MYLLEMGIALGLALLLVLPISAAEEVTMTPELTAGGFIYWYKIISDTAWMGRDMPSNVLAAYAYQAYEEMQREHSSSRQNGIPSHRLPPRVSAMSVPADSLVFITSSAMGRGRQFAYHPDNVPPQVTELLRNPLISGGWSTDTHRVGGSCSEIVCLSVYYDEFPYRAGLPSPLGAKIVTVGVSHSRAGLSVAVEPPCQDTDDGGGCMSFLMHMGMRWCGPGSTTNPLYRREEATPTSASYFDCHGADAPPQFTDSKAVPEAAMNTTSWVETFTAVASIVTDKAGASLPTFVPAFAVGTNEVATSSILFDPATFSTQVSSAGATATTTPVDASKIVGDEGKEASSCVPECIAGFNGCNSGPTRSTVQVMSCQTLAHCYLIQPPYQSAVASPGVDSNPEDPNAKTGPAAQPKIDMDKARTACNDACKAIQSPPSKDSKGEVYGLNGLWTCLRTAQGG